MGMLDRIKKRQNDGFKEFVISMESSNPFSRGQIFTTGVLEDPIFMMHVMKNIRSFDDFLQLDSGELETILYSQDQMMTLLAKGLFQDVARLSAFETNNPKIFARLKDELSYLKEVPTAETEGAKVFLVKAVRKFQQEEKIMGFHWKLPPQDVYYPKQYKDGDVQIFFDNGVLAAEGPYLKGKRMGAWKHNYDMGNLLAHGDYFDGSKEGEWQFFYSSGKMKAQGKYRNDLKHGIWREWDRNGNIKEVEYVEGVRKDLA